MIEKPRRFMYNSRRGRILVIGGGRHAKVVIDGLEKQGSY